MIDFFKTVPLFSDLEDRILSKLMAIVQLKSYKKGEVIFDQGAQGDMLFIIKQGSINVYKEKGTTKIILASLFEGDYFGEMALLTHEPRSCSVEAGEETELLCLLSQDFDNLLKTQVDITYVLLKTLSKRLKETGDKLFKKQYSLLSKVNRG